MTFRPTQTPVLEGEQQVTPADLQSNFNPAPQQPLLAQPQGRVYTQEEMEDLLGKARSQEKDKLYSKMTEQEKILAELKADADLRKSEEAQRQEEAEKARRAAEDAELSATQLVEKRRQEMQEELERTRLEFSQKFEEERRAREAAEEITRKEREFSDLLQYTQQARANAADSVAPELVDLIQGNTKEEVDASVAKMQQRTAAIWQSLAQEGVVPPQQQQQQEFQQPAPQTQYVPQGVSPNSGPSNFDPTTPSGPLTAEDLAKMDNAEYFAWRQKNPLSAATNNYGLYG